LERRSGQNYRAVKIVADIRKIALIKGHDCSGPAVDCCFQNHIVVRIGKAWPPSEGKSNWRRHYRKIVKYMPDVVAAQSASG
jgi:hypothetical protein